MHILIATNGSPQSDLAVRLGAFAAEATGSEVTLLTVISQGSQREQAGAILSRAASILRAKATAVRKRILIGQPAEQILRAAGEGPHDLVILGDHLKPGFRLQVIAPTAERVIARKPCPVLIARGPARPLTKVLVCEGGRVPSLLSRLVERSKPLVDAFSEITVLHVMSQIPASPGVQDWELEADADELIEKHTPEGRFLEKDLDLLEPLDLKRKAKVKHGLVVESILEEAKNGDYDLVVIGAHESEGWQRYLLDDLAHEIILKVDRPVLIV